jgi:type IX secretion system PorP/SprF family membrane protein
MKKHLLFLAFATSAILSTAQQDPQFTNWMFDRLSFNPAAAGMKRMHCVQAFHRDQWDGFDRDPKTYLFNYNGYMVGKQGPIQDKLIGFGASFYSEVLGQETNTVLRASGAYHHQFNKMTVSAGLQLGMYSKKLGKDWIYIDPDDSAIPTTGVSQTGLDASLGIMLYEGNKYYAGVSATHLNAANLDKLNIQVARHYYFMGGYNYDINSDFTLRTNALLKSDFSAPVALDVNANVLWSEMIWGGLSFRPGDAIAPMVGFQKDLGCKTQDRKTFCQQFKIGYSYDITLSQIKDYSAGSHEIFACYCFNFSKAPLKSRHGNPRFL